MNPATELHNMVPYWATPLALSFYNQYFRNDPATELQDLLAVIYYRYMKCKKDNHKHYGSPEKIEQSIKYACINDLIKLKIMKQTKKRNEGRYAVPFSILDVNEDSESVAYTFADELSDAFKIEGMRVAIVSMLNDFERSLFEFLWNNHFASKLDINRAVQRKFRMNRCRSYKVVADLQNRCFSIYEQLKNEQIL